MFRKLSYSFCNSHIYHFTFLYTYVADAIRESPRPSLVTDTLQYKMSTAHKQVTLSVTVSVTQHLASSRALIVLQRGRYTPLLQPLTRPTEDALCLKKDKHLEEIPEKVFLQKKGLAARLHPKLDLRRLDAALSSDYTPFQILVTLSDNCQSHSAVPRSVRQF